MFSSCLKDTGPVQDFSTSPPVVSFQGNGQGSNSESVAVLANSSSANPATDSVEVALGASSVYLSTAVSVTVVTDQSVLDTYNANNGTSYTMLPAADFAISNNGAINIQPGKNLGKLAVNFFGSSIDFTQSYAVPLLINKASGGGSVIASNLNYYILIVTPANQYSGNYTANGLRTLYAGGTTGSGVVATSGISGTVGMTYINDSTSETQLADLAGDFMYLTVHSDNTVTVGPATNGDPTFASLANNGPCTYDPNSKTFSLNYLYINGAGHIRTITQTLVKQ
jgi:hypothetical protein